MQRRHWVVLVVLLLIGVAAGLLFPAINRFRGAADRMQCQANLKICSLALHTYADTYPENRDGKAVPAFPAGAVPNPDLPPEQRLSWYVSILPFMEQDHVFKLFDRARGSDAAMNQSAAKNRFRWIVCPASGEWISDSRGDRWKSPAPLTHYVGVAGVGEDAASLPLGHPRAGAFGHDRRTPLKNGFPDGVSNTLLVIETGNSPGHWAFGGHAIVRAFEPGSAPYIGPGRPFGGFHSGPVSLVRPRDRICIAGLADGSYRYFTDKTDPAVLEALATVGGKEPLPADW